MLFKCARMDKEPIALVTVAMICRLLMHLKSFLAHKGSITVDTDKGVKGGAMLFKCVRMGEESNT